MAVLPDSYDEALANIIRKGYHDLLLPGDTGNRYFMLHTSDPGDTGANEVTGLSRTGIALNEVQELTVSGTPTGGTLTITYDGDTTSGISFDAAPSAVETAMEALSSIGTGNVVCTGGTLPSGTVSIEYVKDLGQQSLALATADGSGLTGGSTPDATIAEATDGFDYLGSYSDDGTSGGRITSSTVLISLGTASAGETATHGSLWTAATGGTMVIQGTLAGSVTYSNGQPVEVAIGDLDLFGAGFS